MDRSRITPAIAYWNQRSALLDSKQRLEALFSAVDSPTELALFQWAQLYAYAREYRPDLILELGREMGNSTCVFTEAANSLKEVHESRVVSVCWSDKFSTLTVPRLKRRGLVTVEWMSRLECRRENILEVDYESLLSPCRRVMVFWDAHGFEIAQCVLGKILPLLQGKEHCLLMHDLSDQRYMSDELLSYDGKPIWAGDSHSESRLVLGHVTSAVAQAISIVDFCTRNRVALESADHTFHQELATDGKADKMRKMLGDDLFSLQGHWFFLSLNMHEGPFTFPGTTAS